MLQRIQTVYLLIIVALSLATMFLSLGTIQASHSFLRYEVSGIVTPENPPVTIYPTWALMALVAVIVLVAMVTVFLYKRRIFQIRLCVFNGILMLAFYGLFFYYYFDFSKMAMRAEGMETSFSPGFALAFPLVSLILDYLAIRNIGADETLVRSLDRLR